jgi:alginate O-acetyltransferase complex protein AlgI
MVFSSLLFIFGFAPAALIGFYLLSRLGPRLAAAWLVLMSLLFYAYWNLAFTALLLGSIAFNYTVARLIFANAARPKLQSTLLVVGISADLCALLYYKYLFALLAFLRVHSGIDVPFQELILPLGISFFTFTQIGYLVDVRQGVAKDRNLLDYLLFVTFFPHLIAGPILHNREMMPQFANTATYRFTPINLAAGVAIFLMGLAKKTLLADPLSSGVAVAFGATASLDIVESWYAAVAYSLQLYFDFSGYSDMAIGLAIMFNVRFPLNFNSPYKATTVIDFWQRWHMTLTRFITMYIFSPIALWVTRRRMRGDVDSSRMGSATLGGFSSLVIVPTMITMGLAGIWHGAGMQFLIFGLLHGAYITFNHAMRIFFPANKKQTRSHIAAITVHAAKILATYLAVLVAFVFFRAPSPEAAMQLLGGMAGMHDSATLGDGLPAHWVAHIALLLAIIWMAPNTQELMGNYDVALGVRKSNKNAWSVWQPKWRLENAWLWFVGGVLFAVTIMAMSAGVTEFLYFQF